MKFRPLLIAAFTGIASFIATSPVLAGACDEHFAGGQAPIIMKAAMQRQARPLCYSEFSVMHSGVTLTPLWSAEKLTREKINLAHSLVRENVFHPESDLPASERAELRDYSRSGYDRGHLTPSGDASNQAAQNQTFTLANMIPQNPDNNRNLWSGLESAVRTMVKQRGTLYVVTGPLFEGATLERLNNRVMVPTSIYKVVYDPERRQAAAYVAKNQSGMSYQVVSVASIEARAGINLLPSVPELVKASIMSLPAPTPHGFGDSAQHGVSSPAGNSTHPMATVAKAGLTALAVSHMYKRFTHRRY